MKTKTASRRVRKIVTVWSHPNWSQGLVLEGYAQDTKKAALEYLGAGDNGAKLKATVETMTVAQIERLEEFSG